MSKSDERRKAVLDEAQQEETQQGKAPEVPKFRYQCEGCTNDAIKSVNLMHGIRITCPTCGKEQTTKPENWIVI